MEFFRTFGGIIFVLSGIVLSLVGDNGRLIILSALLIGAGIGMAISWFLHSRARECEANTQAWLEGRRK